MPNKFGEWRETSMTSDGVNPPRVAVKSGSFETPYATGGSIDGDGSMNAVSKGLEAARRAKRRARYASGGGVDEPLDLPRVSDPTDRVLDGYVLPRLSNKERRAIQRRAMAGLDPTDDEAEQLAADRPRLERNAERLSDMLTPIQAYGEFAADPSIANATNAGVKTALTAFRPLAAAGALGAGYGTAAAKDLGLFDLAAGAQTARESNARARAAEAEGRAAAARARADADMARARTEAERQAAAIRAQEADAELERQRKALEKDEYDRAVRAAEANLAAEKADAKSKYTPFRDTATGAVYDKVGVATPLLATFGAGALTRAAMGKSGGRLSSAVKDWAVPAGLGALEGGFMANWPLIHPLWFAPAENPDKAPYQHYARDLPPTHPRKQEWTEYAERLPKDNPARTAASEELYDPTKLAERSLMGAGEGIVGGLLGAKVGKAAGAAGRQAGNIVEEIATLPGRAMAGWSRGMESADAARARALTVADDVKRLSQRSRGEQQLLEEVGQLKAGAGPRSTGPSAASGEVGPETVAPTPIRKPMTVYSGLPEDRLPTPEVSPNPALEAPKASHYRYRDRLGRLVHKDEVTHRFVPDPRKPQETSEKVQPRKGNVAGTKTLQVEGPKDAVVKEPVPRGKVERTAEEDLADPAKMRRGQKDGGISRAMGGTIDRALSVAGRYASGGNVHVGAVVGDTGGRSDDLPVSVPAGAFVIPADVVSALGEGNSLAGCKNLDRMFKTGRDHMAAGGQAIPIKISDGEYVISPSAVAKIGNGDMDMGHRTLDKFVLGVRKQHINQLKSLPPPAR